MAAYLILYLELLLVDLLLELRKASLASLIASLVSNLSSSISQMEGHTLGEMGVIDFTMYRDKPGQVEELLGWRTSKKKDSDGKIPIVRIFFKSNNPAHGKTCRKHLLLLADILCRPIREAPNTGLVWK
jgi:hypothetical protein